MTTSVSGLLFQSFGGKPVKKAIDTDLDVLFKNSAGPAKFLPTLVQTLSSTQPTTSSRPSKSKRENADENGVATSKKKGNGEKSALKGEQGKVGLEEQYELKKRTQQAVEKAQHVDRKRKKEESKPVPAKKQKISFDTKETASKKVPSKKANMEEENQRSSDDDEMELDGSEEEDREESGSEPDGDPEMTNDEEDFVPPQHESLTKPKKDDKERLERTIFVGNLPVSAIGKVIEFCVNLVRLLLLVLIIACHNACTITIQVDYRKFKVEFAKYGKIESIRFRSIAFAELLPRKIAFITGKLHSERDIVNAYVVYENATMAKKALEMNGKLFLEKHLRVDGAANPKSHDRKRSVFVGNLAFDAQEERLWAFFKDCGEIENVRIVRDSKTNLGKGFAYVQFVVCKENVSRTCFVGNRESVDLALQLHETKSEKRKLRVQRCLLSRSEADNPGSGRSRFRDRATNRAAPLLGKRGGSRPFDKRGGSKPFDKRQHGAAPSPKVFEGVRASKGGGKRKKERTTPRIRARTQAFKLGHVKRKSKGNDKST
ncbi:hypothetical protein BC936DRAFT_144932 [Jimgerdemannia flammicorona]|uniref:Nucleolar protein 12 n=1 Tax=Jimgerdemannia flammicorona TaxID=994334 RepID=A0A433DM42_9FUNG|nr:hypothetical protein BC936DRAFT_144932 [Jimgerdemannia flammicorona]